MHTGRNGTRRAVDFSQPHTFEEVMVAFLKHSKAHKRSHRDDIFRTRTLRTFFAGRDFSSLTTADVHAYVSNRLESGRANATINRELMLLSAAITHAGKAHAWELPNPVRPCLLSEPQGRVRWITREESQRLIEAARQSDKAPYLADFIMLALHTGCRSGELLGLEWARVNFTENFLLLEAQHTKTATRRTVPLNRQALAALHSRLAWRNESYPTAGYVFLGRDGQPIGSIKRSFASALEKAGIKDFRIHDMRHTCAAWLVTAGIPLIVVRDLLGHTSIKTTEIYAHLAPDNIRQAVAVLDGK